MTHSDMECELEEYLSNIGLSSDLLQSASAVAPVDGHALPTSAAAESRDDDDEDEDDDGEAFRPVVDATAVDGGQASSTAGGFDSKTAASANVYPTADVYCRTAVDDRSTRVADCDTRSENLTLPAVLHSSPENGDITPWMLSSNDHIAVLGSRQQQTAASSGNLDHGSELPEIVPAQSGSSRPAVVFSTVPRHVDAATSSRTSHASSSSSCTIMLTGDTPDVVRSSSPATAARTTPDVLRSSPTAPRRAAAVYGNEEPRRPRPVADERLRPTAEVAGRVRRDATLPYTSTIIRCSASSAPVIATSSNKSRDRQAPAALDDDDCDAVPPHVKTTPNYVSVVQIGSATNDRREITQPPPMRPPTTTTLLSADSAVDGGLVTLGRSSTMLAADSAVDGSVTVGRSSPLTGHVRVQTSTADSGTPIIKSSLKKVAPGHVKSKSVSFSPEDGDDVDAASGDQRHADAVIRVTDGGGGAGRRALVSDSGVFCEETEDDVDDSGRGATSAVTPASRRTTVIVSGGTASTVDSSPRRHQRGDQPPPDNHSGSPGGGARDAGGGTGSLRPRARYSAAANVTDDAKHPSTEHATTPQARHKTSPTTQVYATRSPLPPFHSSTA